MWDGVLHTRYSSTHKICPVYPLLVYPVYPLLVYPVYPVYPLVVYPVYPVRFIRMKVYPVEVYPDECLSG